MLLAMSGYQLSQPDEARAALARGLQMADAKLAKIESGDLGRSWPDWVFAHVLMREAKALIEGGAKTKTSDRSVPLKDSP